MTNVLRKKVRGRPETAIFQGFVWRRQGMGFGLYTTSRLIYMEIGTGEEIDPSQIVDHRTDVAEEYNEAFVETEELESLW